MAEVRLGKFESEAGRLPKLCIRCGQATSTTKTWGFDWIPGGWITLVFFGLFVTPILGSLYSKEMTVHVPFCHRHRNHLFNRALVIYLSLAVLICTGFGLLFWAVALKEQRAEDDPWLGSVCVGFTVLILVWIVLVAIVQGNAVRVKKIEANSITLKGVSPLFIAALKESRKKGQNETPDG